MATGRTPQQQYRSRVDEVVSDLEDLQLLHERGEGKLGHDWVCIWPQMVDSPFFLNPDDNSMVREAPMVRFPSIIPSSKFYSDLVGLTPPRPLGKDASIEEYSSRKETMVNVMSRMISPKAKTISPSRIKSSSPTKNNMALHHAGTVKKNLLNVKRQEKSAKLAALLTKAQLDKYFGEEARGDFFSLYRKLHDDRNLFTKDQAGKFTRLRHQMIKHRMEVHEKRKRETAAAVALAATTTTAALGKEKEDAIISAVNNSIAEPTSILETTPGEAVGSSSLDGQSQDSSSKSSENHDFLGVSTSSSLSTTDVILPILQSSPKGRGSQSSFYPPSTNDSAVEGSSIESATSSGLVTYEDDDELDLFGLIENMDDTDESYCSPREEYIKFTLESQRLPTPGEVLRRRIDATFDISHKGIGDEYAILLSKALGELPAIRHLNLSDNRLTDTSLKELLAVVVRMKELRSLNLASNTMNEVSSLMLRNYLSSGKATITTLILSKADIDDEECDAFVKAISHNHNLTSVDLSRNLIGVMESKNTVQPDFNTGAEAIAELLQTEGCHLRALDLSWNHIRAGSASALAASLSVNKNLTSLNLEYNNLGAAGGNVVAKALYENTTLRRLNICNNQIMPRAAYAIAMALRKKKQLEYLNILENPIGYAGGRAMMGVALDLGGDLHIKMGSCNFQMKDPTAWFDADKPDGLFQLDFEDAYDRSVMEDLIHMATSNDAILIQKVKYTLGKDSRNLQLEVASEDYLESSVKTHLINDKDLKELFTRYAGKKARLRASGLLKALEQLGLGPYSHIKMQEFISYYDLDGSYTIDLVEFLELVQYEVKVVEETRPRRFYMREKGASGVWEVPSRGKASVKVQFCPVLTKAGHLAIDKQIENFLRICPEFPNGKDPIKLARTYLTLHPDQAQGIYDDILKLTGNKVEAVVSLLAQTHNPKSARRILNSNLPGWTHKEERRMVEHELGPLHSPIFGLNNGHYRLDLSKEMHRMAAMRLLLLSNEERAVRASYRPDKYDTSQHGGFSNFRNQTFRGKPLRLSPEFFLDLPSNGMLEFDYVTLLRNPELKQRSICNRRLLHILCSFKLISDFEMMSVQKLLNPEKAKLPTKSVTTAVRTSLELSRLFREELPLDPSLALGTFPPEPTDIELGRPKRASRDTKGLTSPVSGMGSTITTMSMTTTSKLTTTVSKSPSPPEPSTTTYLRSTVRHGGITSKAGGGNNKSAAALAFIRNLGSDPVQLNDCVLNLRLWAKRAKLRANCDTIALALKDLIGTRWFTAQQARLILQCAYPNKEGLISRPSSSESDKGMDASGSFVKEDTIGYSTTVDQRRISADVRRPSSASSSGLTSGNTYPDVPYSCGRVELDISPKINMAIWLHQKILDLHRYHEVLDLFTPEEQAHIIYRVGWLNVFSPLTCDGGIQLCLERREEVIIARLLVHLGKSEPGENWLCQQWRFNRIGPPIPAWTLSINWLSEDGFGNRGYLTLYYYSGDGKNCKGCNPNIKLRLALSMITLSDPPEDLLITHFPELEKASVKEKDAYLKRYLLDNLSKEGISWKYNYVLPS